MRIQAVDYLIYRIKEMFTPVPAEQLIEKKEEKVACNNGPTWFGILLGMFWSMAAIGSVPIGIGAIAGGFVGQGLVSLGLGACCALYARYLFRGGRFYFIVF